MPVNRDAKEMVFEEEARTRLQAGIHKIADAACGTLGPLGCHVGLDKSWGAPTVTREGKSILSEIELADQYEDMGAGLAREMASKVKEVCGDGTTTAIALLRALTDGGIRNVTAGTSPIEIKRGMDKACHAILKALAAQAVAVKSSADKEAIATISASGRTDIGKMIAHALKQVGDRGAVTIEEGSGLETTLELVEGMRFDRGYLSPHFITNGDELSVEMERPAILLADQKIASVQEILPLLQGLVGTGRPLLIIAEDVEADCLATLVINRLRGHLNVCAVKAPGFGEKRSEMLGDLVTLTAGKCFSEKTDDPLKTASIELLGTCDKVIITKDTTTLIGGAATKKELDVRIAQLNHLIEEAANDYDREQLEQRKAKLQGGVAVIRVGGGTEREMKQNKRLMQDSLNATRAAVEEGTVIGGGVALLRAASAIHSLSLTNGEAVGAQVVAKACSAPLRQLVENSGGDGSVVVRRVQEGTEGFNAQTGAFEDLQKAGILDPAKVVSAALTHAVSSAGVILLSEVLIGDAEED